MSPQERFRSAVLPHLDAAFNLARWLLENPDDAEDAVQDAAVRAFASISKLRDADGRVWFLAIVRNTCMNKIRSKGARNRAEVDCGDEVADIPATGAGPEELLIRAHDAEVLQRAIAALPPVWREVLILREFEGLSYREIASITESPVGSVMSRLSRARAMLSHTLRCGEGA